MDLIAFFLLLLLLAFVILFIVRPFGEARRLQKTEAGQELSTLLAERDRVLKGIQELDFDNSLGKIPADEYPTERQVLLKTGADVLRQIDALNPSRSILSQEMEESLRLAQAVSVIPPHPALVTDEDVEVLIAERRANRKEKMGGFCSKCGKPFLKSDRFCSCCGQPVGGE